MTAQRKLKWFGRADRNGVILFARWAARGTGARGEPDASSRPVKVPVAPRGPKPPRSA